MGGFDVDFETVFARIAGARYAGGDTGDRTFFEPVVFDGGEFDGRNLLQRFERVRALHGDLGVLIACKLHLGVEAFFFLRGYDVVVVFLLIGGVDADEDKVVRDFVDQDVVDESAVFVKQAGVMSLAVLEFRYVVGGDVLGKLLRFGGR